MDIFALDLPYFFLSEGHNFIGQVQNSDTSFCFDRPAAARFRSEDYRRNSDRASANILGRDAFVLFGSPMAFLAAGQGAKVLSLPDCGMGAATGIGMIRDFVGDFALGRR